VSALFASITWVEIVGCVATVLNIIGNLMLARLRLGGWVIRLLTNIVWVVYSLNTNGGWPLMLNHLVFFYINLDGWLAWRRAQRSGVLRHPETV
jgi:nicotinamide riboside transporter PnuC